MGMYGGIGIPIDVGENECVTVKNAIEIIVPFWDDLVQEKIKQYIFDNLKKHSLPLDCFLGIEIRQIRDSRTKVFVYFNDEQPARAIIDKHSRTCGGRRVSVSAAQVINKRETQKTQLHKKKRSHRSKNKKSVADQMGNMNLDELYPLQATYYYQPQQQQEIYYQQSEASFTTIDSGFDAHE